MFRNISVRAKFFIIVILIMIPLIINSISSIAQSYESEVIRKLVAYEDLAEAISTSFGNYIQEIWTFEDLIGTYIRENPQLSDSEISDYLIKMNGIFGTLLRIDYLDLDGSIVASSDPLVVGENLGSEDYFREMAEGRAKLLPNIVVNHLRSKERILPVVRGVYSRDQLIGILVAIIDTGMLGVKLPDLNIDQDNRYQLIDQKGTLVYSSDIAGTPNDMVNLLSESTIKSALEGKLVASNRIYSSLDNTYIMSVDYPISELGWVCRVSSPYSIALIPPYRQLYTSAIILAAAVFVSLIVAWIFSHYFMDPLRVLTNAARKIMEGDYSVRTNIRGKDELGLAAEAFDKMAESIERGNEIKSQYFASMSHELKTPINVIFSSVQLIESYQSKDPEQFKVKVMNQMRIIRQNCYRIMRLVGNIIDLSRHESGFLEIKPDNYDIVKLARDITLSVQRYVEIKGIKLIFETSLESKTIACDPDMVERILLNLITNAIKFTDKGGTITVSLEEAGNNILLCVKDTGMGIQKEKLAVIFDRYKKADDDSGRNREGTGIGLSLVKAFVEAHGGSISVSSEVMKGTAFHISLPSRTLDKSRAIAKKASSVQTGDVSRINIEFSDIYNNYNEDIS